MTMSEKPPPKTSGASCRALSEFAKAFSSLSGCGWVEMRFIASRSCLLVKAPKVSRKVVERPTGGVLVALVPCRYYRDRLSVPRGPCNISVLRECWVHGVIDDGTLVWGQGLMDWLPVKNVRTLVPQIRTFEGISPSALPSKALTGSEETALVSCVQS